MATHKVMFLVALTGLTATALAQTAAPENWTPIGRMAQTITGRVMFTPSEITFQNGKSLPLARGGQMLFRPEPKQKKVLAAPEGFGLARDEARDLVHTPTRIGCAMLPVD
jgi:hypothetical protein